MGEAWEPGSITAGTKWVSNADEHHVKGLEFVKSLILVTISKIREKHFPIPFIV